MAVAKKTTKKVVPAKKVVKKAAPRKGIAKVAPARAKAPSKYQSALANPEMNSTTRKVAIRPYSAEWKAEVNRKNKAYDKSWWKKAGYVAENFTPLGASDAVYRAVKGRDAKTGKKYNRLTAATDAAFMLAPFGGKKVVKAVKAAKGGRNVAMQVMKDTSVARHAAMDIPISGAKSSAKKEAAALAYRKKKVATARQGAKNVAATKKTTLKKIKRINKGK
jgi:hypothetical protein